MQPVPSVIFKQEYLLVNEDERVTTAEQHTYLYIDFLAVLSIPVSDISRFVIRTVLTSSMRYEVISKVRWWHSKYSSSVV